MVVIVELPPHQTKIEAHAVNERTQPHSPQQSPNWDKYRDHIGFVQSGYPFYEGFPTSYAGKTYELICRSGQHLTALVSDSYEHEAEGLCWQTTSSGSILPELIVAWRELPAKE